MQMFFGVLIHAFFTVEHHEEHTERIERSNKYTTEHSIISKITTSKIGVMNNLNDRIF